MEPKWHGSYPHRRARSCLAGWVDSRFLACRRSTDDDPARPGQLGGHLLPGVSRLNTVSIRAAAGNGRRGTWMRRVVSVDGEVLPSPSAAFEGQPALLQCRSVSRRLQNLEREC